MSANANSTPDSPPAYRWRLWIDGCGGFLLLSGNQWSVGGLSQEELADICVRADWPRRAGQITRQASDYFWIGAKSDERRQLVANGQTLPIDGSATVSLHQPTPLSNSATLRLSPPHRFHDHVDGVVLVHETLLVGPQTDCHIHCPQLNDRAVLALRGDQWRGKVGLAEDFEEIQPGCRITLSSLAMMLEQA